MHRRSEGLLRQTKFLAGPRREKAAARAASANGESVASRTTHGARRLVEVMKKTIAERRGLRREAKLARRSGRSASREPSFVAVSWLPRNC